MRTAISISTTRSVYAPQTYRSPTYLRRPPGLPKIYFTSSEFTASRPGGRHAVVNSSEFTQSARDCGGADCYQTEAGCLRIINRQ
jgi:hypothetical protein